MISLVSFVKEYSRKFILTVPKELVRNIRLQGFSLVFLTPVTDEDILREYGILKVICPRCNTEGWLYSCGKSVYVIHEEGVFHRIRKSSLLESYPENSAILELLGV